MMQHKDIASLFQQLLNLNNNNNQAILKTVITTLLTVKNISQLQAWEIKDLKFYGRCYISKTIKEIAKNSSIYKIVVTSETDLRVLLHNHGLLGSMKAARINFRDVIPATKQRINVLFKVMKSLSSEKIPCLQNDQDYIVDDCILSLIEEKLNCTTPFEAQKTYQRHIFQILTNLMCVLRILYCNVDII